VVTHPEDVDYGASIPITIVKIVDLAIPSAYVDTDQHLHPHVECDQPSPPLWVVDPLSSHDFLDTKFPSKESILEVMASIDKPREDENHHTFLPDLELMIINIMSLASKMGALTRTSIQLPSLDPFPPQISFSKLANEFYTTSSIKDSCFLLPSCLVGSYQGYSIAHKTTRDEHLQS
jgi:hypothetical protein